jgi:hypothetical protein
MYVKIIVHHILFFAIGCKSTKLICNIRLLNRKNCIGMLKILQQTSLSDAAAEASAGKASASATPRGAASTARSPCFTFSLTHSSTAGAGV